MNKRTLITFLCFSAITPMMAQDIKGKIVNEKGEPLAFANVVLLNRQDSAFVKGVVSGEDGHFAIDSACNNGIIKVTSVGYKTAWKDCTGENAGVIKMVADSKVLGEVVVKSLLPKTILKNGGMTTTVAGSILEKAGTMEHLLDRIPNVSAQNGNIKVFGRGEPIIYINGRQMRDRSELDRLSSDNIKSVEVIANPGARYAASTKAVIRITTKKILGDGFGFDATTEGSYDEKKNAGGYARLNLYYRRNGLELGAYAYGSKQSSPDEKDLQQMTYLDKTWNQQDRTRWKNKTETFSSRLNASYQFDNNNSLGASISFLRNPKLQTDGKTEGSVLRDEVLTETNTSIRSEFGQNSNWSSNVYYVGKVGKLGIDFNTDWFWSKGNNKNNIDEHYQEVNSEIQNQLVNSTTSKYNRLIASKMVLSYPLFGGDLSVGGEYSFTNRNTNYAIIPNTLADNVIDRIKEGMASAFVAYNRDFGKLNMEAGLRYENVDFKYYDNGKYMAEQSKTYGEWFPSLSLSMPIGNVQMQLSYAADINRPNYWVLRSGVQYSNHYTYETGNPFLVSEISRNTSYDLAYKWLTFNLTYEHVSDPIYQTVEMYKDNATIGLMRMINGKSYNNVTSTLNLQPTFGIWHPMLSAMVEKQWFELETRDGRYLNKPVAMFRFNNTFDTKWAMFSVMMTYITKGYEENHYIYKPMFNTNLSIYKGFMKDCLTLQLYVNDVFGTNDSHIIGKYGKLKETIFDEFSTSKISLTVRYKFNTTRSKYKGTGAGDSQKNRM
ncbi:TonB-dependent receptor family protein [Prevotella stercorea]|uniref:TonB-dependent receptor domain-containing protein n=1 Tax=Leyella stercorea TaxID=363265 RepID=UPI001C2B986E|nr:TonB-dependent receptor [Leyella stercorea]MBU9898102.1 TonB-dependent receptor family protein [Leyella stercorea]MBU9946316.1 TonB-dependent receptor family protein [Leyella stercorea]